MNEAEMKELEEKIVAQCELRKAEGWVIGHWAGIYSLPDGGCQACALGSFADETEIDQASFDQVAHRALGLEGNESEAFADGFDRRGAPSDPELYDIYQVGQRCSERVLSK